MIKIAFSGHTKRRMGVEYMKHAHHFTHTLQGFLSHFSKGTYSFITGCATGVDDFAASYALSHDIPLDIYCPFPLEMQCVKGNRTQEEKLFLLDCFKRARTKTIISQEFEIPAYYKRDQTMVDNCDFLLTWMWTAYSGTFKCMKYARSIGKPVLNLRKWRHTSGDLPEAIKNFSLQKGEM